MTLQSSASHGGLLSDGATPLQEEEDESLDDSSLPVPGDLEDRNAYESGGGLRSTTTRRMMRIPKLRPPSFVSGGGWSPISQRKMQGANSVSSSNSELGHNPSFNSISEHRY